MRSLLLGTAVVAAALVFCAAPAKADVVIGFGFGGCGGPCYGPYAGGYCAPTYGCGPTYVATGCYSTPYYGYGYVVPRYYGGCYPAYYGGGYGGYYPRYYGAYYGGTYGGYYPYRYGSVHYAGQRAGAAHYGGARAGRAAAYGGARTTSHAGRRR